jgi:hypothetical protein
MAQKAGACTDFDDIFHRGIWVFSIGKRFAGGDRRIAYPCSRPSTNN